MMNYKIERKCWWCRDPNFSVQDVDPSDQVFFPYTHLATAVLHPLFSKRHFCNFSSPESPYPIISHLFHAVNERLSWASVTPRSQALTKVNCFHIFTSKSRSRYTAMHISVTWKSPISRATSAKGASLNQETTSAATMTPKSRNSSTR